MKYGGYLVIFGCRSVVGSNLAVIELINVTT